MENKHQNIDKLFKEAFNGWEADASPLEIQADWSRLSQQLPQVPVNTPAVPKPLWGTGKIIGLVATGAVVTTVGILTYNILTENASKQEVAQINNQQEVVTAPAGPNVIAEDNNANKGEAFTGDGIYEDKTVSADAYKNIQHELNKGTNTKASGKSDQTPYKATDKNASGSNANDNLSGSNNNNNPKNDVRNDVPATPQNEKPEITGRFNKNSLIYSDTIFCLGKELNIKYNESAIAENVVVDWGDGTKEKFSGNANHIYATSGKYFVRFTANNRPVASKLISVEDKPVAEFTVRECDGLKCKFRNTSKSGYIYMWNFGDGSPADRNINAEHTFSDTGEYKITLTAYSAGNCENSYTNTVRVREFNAPVINNIFTPNGDGDNDKFTIFFKERVSYYELTVVDRTGAKVFETRDPSQDWDGTVMNNGTACPNGSYFYILKYKYAADGKLKQEQGAVQLNR